MIRALAQDETQPLVRVLCAAVEMTEVDALAAGFVLVVRGRAWCCRPRTELTRKIPQYHNHGVIRVRRAARRGRRAAGFPR